MTTTELEREVHLLKGYAAVSTVVFLVALLVVLGRAQSGRQRFGEIDVERINVVDADGTLALVLANRQRLPGPLVEGKEFPKTLSQGRTGAAGMLFVDVQGNEVGGLAYGATVRQDGGYTAGSSLTFDQHHQDQVLGFAYSNNGTARGYGLNVWDRPTKISMKDVLGVAGGNTDRQTIERRFRELMKERGETQSGVRRVFLGSQDRTAALRLMDTAGRERVRITVDNTDTPRLQFLDPTGATVYELPQRTP